MPDAKTKKAYALIDWDDENGTTDAGSQVELPFETPDDQANFERLAFMGYISTTKPNIQQKG